MVGAGGAFAEGKSCRADVTLSDVEAGKRFHGELFGWTFDPSGPLEQGSYAPARLGGEQARRASAPPCGDYAVWLFCRACG
jgi:uncharacterized protein